MHKQKKTACNKVNDVQMIEINHLISSKRNRNENKKKSHDNKMISKEMKREDHNYRDNTRKVEQRRGYHKKRRKSVASGLYSVGSGVETELWNLVKKREYKGILPKCGMHYQQVRNILKR